MPDTNQDRNTQSDALHQLKNISNGILSKVPQNQNLIIPSNKFSNEVMREMAADLRKEGFEDKEILNSLLDYDELIEKGELTTNNLNEVLDEVINTVEN